MLDQSKGLRAVVGRANSSRRASRPTAENEAALVAFDVLQVGKQDLTGWDLERRRMVLVTATEAPRRAHISMVAPLVRKVEAWGMGIVNGWEGVVLKRLDSTYRPGVRSDAWLKVKYRYELTVLAYALVPSSSGSGYGSLRVGVLEDNDLDRLVPIGTVGTGFTEADMRSVISELGYGRPSPVVISCMGRTAGGLREPVFLRFDRSPGISAPAAQLDDLPTF
jgi:bifunctional non-homologous end joining protein LigD